MIILGSEVIDGITGFKGIAVSEYRYLHGCLRYGVQPKLDKEGKVPDALIFDEPQLKVTKAVKAKPIDTTGGPRTTPTRRTVPATR